MWFDERQGLEDWTNKRPLPDYYKPFNASNIKSKDILLTFKELERGKIPEVVKEEWRKLVGRREIMLCN